MSVKFLQPPSPESRAFACVHRLAVVRQARAVVEAPLSEAQRAALEAHASAAPLAAPLPAAAPAGRFQGWRVP